MRQLARFPNEEPAQTLGAALYLEGIESTVESSRDGAFLLWVHDETKLDRARELLAEFERIPFDPRFAQARAQAGARQRTVQREERKSRPPTVKVRDRWASARGIGPASLVLIAISVGLTLLTRFGENPLFAHFRYPGRLDDLLGGEVWRVLTPIFIHLSLLHLLFNMWWLKDLGTLVERLQSTRLFALLVLVVALISNTAQFLIDGPGFGGMSGVLYGLFGYIWIRGRFDPLSGYHLPRFTVGILLGWFVLCWSGAVGPIANMAHTGGLVVGALWGFLSSGWLTRRR